MREVTGETTACGALVLPHAIVQLETGIFCDLELTVGRIPCASRLLVQGEQIMAQGGDYWRERRGMDGMNIQQKKMGQHL